MTVTPEQLIEAWDRYIQLFGEPPHGSGKQLAALAELLPKVPDVNLRAAVEKEVAWWRKEAAHMQRNGLLPEGNEHMAHANALDAALGGGA